MYPAVTRKLRHVTTTERGLVNPYQKPQRLMMRLIEMFSSEGDWILDLFSSTYINLTLCVYSNIFEQNRLASTKNLSQNIVGTTSACALKLFRKTIALETDDEQLSFINLRIKALWECPDQAEEVEAKHIADTERFEAASREPIPPLAGEPGELIDLDDEQIEEPTVARLSGDDTNAQIGDDSSQKEEEENDVDTLITM